MQRKSLHLLACATLIWAAGCESEPEGPPPEGTPTDAAPTEEGTPDGEPPPGAATPDAPAGEAAPLAAIGSMEGTVTVNGEPASDKQKLATGDEVTAAEGSFADLYFGDGSKVRVKNATVNLSKAEEKAFSLELTLGKIYAWITPGTEFDVSGHTAVAGVRGTQFFMEENKKEAYFCVCEGSVGVQKVQKPSKRKKVKEPPPETIIKAGEDLHVPKRKRRIGKPKASEEMVTMVKKEFEDMATRVQ